MSIPRLKHFEYLRHVPDSFRALLDTWLVCSPRGAAPERRQVSLDQRLPLPELVHDVIKVRLPRFGQQGEVGLISSESCKSERGAGAGGVGAFSPELFKSEWVASGWVRLEGGEGKQGRLADQLLAAERKAVSCCVVTSTERKEAIIYPSHLFSQKSHLGRTCDVLYSRCYALTS